MLRRPVAPKSSAWPSFAGSLRAPANRSAGRRRRPDGKDSGRRSRAFRRGSPACRRCPSSQGLHPWEHIGPDGSSSPAHSRRPSDTARRLAEQRPEGLAPGLAPSLRQAASPRRPAGAAPSRRVPRWEGFPPAGSATALGSCSGSPRAPRRAARRKRRWRNASLFEIASASRVECARGGVGASETRVADGMAPRICSRAEPFATVGWSDSASARGPSGARLARRRRVRKCLTKDNYRGAHCPSAPRGTWPRGPDWKRCG